MARGEKTAWVIAAAELVAIVGLFMAMAYYRGLANGRERRAVLCEAACLLSQIEHKPCGAP